MLRQVTSLARADLLPRHCQPSAVRVVLATVTSIAGSHAAAALLVVIAEHVFPAARGYVHFRFSDYAKLTVIGVITAGAAWPVVTRVTLAPRWPFFRLAILVTLVLWLSDLYLLYRNQPPRCGRRPHGHAPGHHLDHLQPARARGPHPPGPAGPRAAGPAHGGERGRLDRSYVAAGRANP